MDWDKLHERAREVVPSYELPPSRCWVGVLHHKKSFQEQLSEEDFVWMIGRDNTSTQKVYDTYKKRYDVADFHLWLRDSMVNTSNIVGAFRSPHDNLVLFRAVPVDDPQVILQSPNTAASNPGAGTPPQNVASNSQRLTVKLKMKSEPTREDVSAAGQDSQSPTHSDSQIEKCETAEHASLPSYQDLPKDHFVRNIIDQESPDALEAGVAESLNVLETLKEFFSQHTTYSQDARTWMESIENLSLQSKRKRTVIGVVGNTGAGKSSVINALLDEERLLPTNCMRACTAVVTEISWNSNISPAAKYRARVEFITPADWEKELKVLLSDFISDNGKLSREASDPSTDAGIAWAKFHAVYPHIARDSLHKCDIPTLMAESGMKILGTTRKIEVGEPAKFYQELQKYVDSKEKIIKKESKPAARPAKKSKPAAKAKAAKSSKPAAKGKAPKKNAAKGKRKQGQPRSMEFWPLIKVVKIYTKASALSTGAVIVDLPGVHDSNAARAAVAQRYLQQCTGLWIVAPITRAVDDKSAKTLLGDSFKLQLKYDGGFSSVTFICSKTDDISLTEAVDALGLQKEVTHLYDQESRYKRMIEDIQNEVSSLKESQEMFQLVSKNTSQELEEWMELQEGLADGKKVYAPAPKSRKRKGVASRTRASKRHQSGDDKAASSNQVSEGFANSDEDDSADEMTVIEPLKEADIRTKLKELRETSKNARQESTQIQSKIDSLQSRIPNLEGKIADIKSKISRICISGRNDYSKRAIQQDFAAGIKELDQEMAVEEDDENFDPDEERRDYDRIGQALPVFCVSSRAYQQHRGRLQQDDAVPGFTSVEETEMPQLQLHSQKTTEAGRIQTARSFLLGLCQQLTAFELWASDNTSGSLMTKQDKIQQRERMKRPLNDLEIGLNETVRICVDSMEDIINDQILYRYPEVIKEAIQLAPETAQGWSAHKGDGGLAWATYRAVVRRDGTFHSATAGQRDFNAELVEPIIKKLATGWDRAFQTRLPKALKSFTKDCGKLLRMSHGAMKQLAEQHDFGTTRLSALDTQISTYEALFDSLNFELITEMSELQREANRDFSPTISSIMHEVYAICADERGRGSYSRMKKHMTEHIDSHRHTMFGKATDTVRTHLDEMCRTLEATMTRKTRQVFAEIKADYMRALVGIQAEAAAAMSKEEKVLREKVLNLLQSMNARFAPIAEGKFIVHEGIGDANSEASDSDIEQPSDTDHDDDMVSSDREFAGVIKVEDDACDLDSYGEEDEDELDESDEHDDAGDSDFNG